MATHQSPSRIVQLARTIVESVTRIEDGFAAKGIASPSFDIDASFKIPPELSAHHDAVLDATSELHDLLLEPLDLIHRHSGHNNSVCMQAIAEFKIADLVPLQGQISYDDIATQTPITSQMTARLLRYAMTMRIFREPEPGMVAHTAASRALSHSPANDWLRSGTQEMWPAAVKMVEALQKWPASEEVNETGYALANSISGTMYEVFARDTERASRFAQGMQIFTEHPQFDLVYVTEHYDWEALGQAQVVDVGGSRGHVSLALAKRFHRLSFIVQDMDRVVQNLTPPEDLQERVKFMAHDFFSPQPIQGADVYYLRWILYNWADKYAMLILRALIPALKPGARVILQETLMPEPGEVALWKERNLRAADLHMAAAFNAQERTKTEFENLLKKCDPALVLRKAIQPTGSALGLLEFVWEGVS